MEAPRRPQRPLLGLIVFFAIAFGLPWAMWVHLRQTASLDHMFDSFANYWFTAAPSLAGFVAAFAEDGFDGLARFVRRVLDPRVSPLLWLAAVGFPLLAALLTFATHPGDLAQGGAPLWAKLLAPFSWLNVFTGPLAEEFGWRGYLLGFFARRMRPVLAGLIIGPIWAAWHVPLFYDSVFATVPSALGYVAWTTAWSVILCLIVARAKGSVLPSILGHWAVNNVTTVFFALLPALAGEKQPGGLAFALASVVLACVVAFLWRDTLWQENGRAHRPA